MFKSTTLLKSAIGSLLGGVAGFLFYEFIGCESG